MVRLGPHREVYPMTSESTKFRWRTREEQEREDAKEEGRKAAARIAAEVYGGRDRRPAHEQ